MEELQHCEILKTNINVTNMSDTIKYIDGHLMICVVSTFAFLMYTPQ